MDENQEEALWNLFVETDLLGQVVATTRKRHGKKWRRGYTVGYERGLEQGQRLAEMRAALDQFERDAAVTESAKKGGGE